MKKVYLVIFEDAGSNWSAYFPNVDGCITTAPTRAAIEQAAQEVLEFHFRCLVNDGDEIPEPAPVDLNEIYREFPFDGIGFVTVDVPVNAVAA